MAYSVRTIKVIDDAEFNCLPNKVRIKMLSNGVVFDLAKSNVSSASLHLIREKMTVWCDENCKSLVYMPDNSVRFFFKCPEEAAAFKLRWDGADN